MNFNILFSDLKNKTFKKILGVSITSVMISTFLLNYSFIDLIEIKFNIYGYIFVVLMSTMLTSIIVFVLTCIISLLVILFDNRFNMKYLYAITYEYVGKTSLITAIFIFLKIILNFNINILILELIGILINLFFIFQYYKEVTLIASVDKRAAKLIIALIIVLSIFINIYF